MNSFVIKSPFELNGKFIGLSEKDSQRIYVFRSHQVFKDLNPNILSDLTILEEQKKHKVINPLKDEFDFRKNNVCPNCGGLKYFYHVACDKPINGKILYDEDGFTLFSEEVCVNCICDDGTYVGYLDHELKMAKRDAKDNINELRLKFLTLEAYVKSRSTCKTCGGDDNKMYTHERCKECGLPGTQRFIMGG